MDAAFLDFSVGHSHEMQLTKEADHPSDESCLSRFGFTGTLVFHCFHFHFPLITVSDLNLSLKGSYVGFMSC